MQCARLLTVVLLVVRATPSVAHAFLKFPPLRGGILGSTLNEYCPQCGNGLGVCGDGGQWGETSNFLDYKSGPRTSFAPGEEVEFEVQVTAHHMGYFEFSVCDRHIDNTVVDSQACLDQHKLKRVAPAADCQPNDIRGDCQPLHTGYPERWYLPPGTGSHKMRFQIPVELNCSSCTLQWRWWTANSCQPASDAGCYFAHMRSLGWDADAWCKGFCGSCTSLLQSSTSRSSSLGCGEEFRNCADISVTAEPEAEVDPEAELEASTLSPTSAPPSPPLAECASCAGCLWSSGHCYLDASQDYCESWDDNMWCGTKSLVQFPSSHAREHTKHRPRRKAAGVATFLGHSLVQDGVSVFRAAHSNQKVEEL